MQVDQPFQPNIYTLIWGFSSEQSIEKLINILPMHKDQFRRCNRNKEHIEFRALKIRLKILAMIKPLHIINQKTVLELPCIHYIDFLTVIYTVQTMKNS